MLTETLYSALLWGDFHVPSVVGHWVNLGQTSTTFMACSSALLWKKSAPCKMFILFFWFFGVLSNPAEQTSMSSLTEKVLSCDNQTYSNVKVTGRGAVLHQYCSHYHQYFTCSLLHQNCFTKRWNVDIYISMFKFILNSICQGIFTCHLVRHKGKGSGRLKSHMSSTQVQPIVLSSVVIYFFSNDLFYSF